MLIVTMGICGLIYDHCSTAAYYYDISGKIKSLRFFGVILAYTADAVLFGFKVGYYEYAVVMILMGSSIAVLIF